MIVDLIVPTYRHVKSDAFHAINGMVNHSREQGHDVVMPEVYNNAYPHWARNDGLARIRKNCEAVLFCDDDMLPQRDALCNLIAHNLPVVSALCTTRTPPVVLTVRSYDEDTGLFHRIDEVEEGCVMVGKIGCGAAFLLVKRKILEAVRDFWLTANDWVADNRGLFTRLGVAAATIEQERARIEKERCAFIRADGGKAVIFDLFSLPNGFQVGEDLGFCRRVIQLGHKVGCDTTVQVAHIGDYPYGPHNLGIKDWRKIQAVA